MAESETVPLEVRDQFRSLGAIPLGVIAELFQRAEVGGDIQTAFWAAAMTKTLKNATGKVRMVRTNRDGTRTVTVLDRTGSVTFNVPDDLTDEQLAELKRAQSARVDVGIEYQVEDGGKRPVNWVMVYDHSDDEKADKGEIF